MYDILFCPIDLVMARGGGGHSIPVYTSFRRPMERLHPFLGFTLEVIRRVTGNVGGKNVVKSEKNGHRLSWKMA